RTSRRSAARPRRGPDHAGTVELHPPRPRTAGPARHPPLPSRRTPRRRPARLHPPRAAPRRTRPRTRAGHPRPHHPPHPPHPPAPRLLPPDPVKPQPTAPANLIARGHRPDGVCPVVSGAVSGAVSVYALGYDTPPRAALAGQGPCEPHAGEGDCK